MDSAKDTSLTNLVAEMVDEYNAAVERGEQVDIGAIADKHPEFASEVKTALEIVQSLDSLDDNDLIGDRAHHEDRRLKTIGDFQLQREIGRGGMGVVYEAEQISMGRTVALKVLPFAAVMDEKAITRFKNEARAAGTLHHDNIVPVHAVGNDRGVYYYAMALIEGSTLAEVIEDLKQRVLRRGGDDKNECLVDQIAPDRTNLVADVEFGCRRVFRPTSECLENQRVVRSVEAERETARLIHGALSTRPSLFGRRFYDQVALAGIQAADALHHAHEHGIVHRDVKPGNLMIDPTGKVWVTDFGLARIESDAGMTMTGDVLGTLRYMAPEQATGSFVVDHRADIYSLGVTLYELLTLRPVFEAANREKLLKQLTLDEPTPIRQIHPVVPRDLETVVMKAVSKDPDERYATAADLAADLRRFAESRPIHARPPSSLMIVRKSIQRHPQVMALMSATAIVISLITAGAAAVSSHAYRQERTQKEVATAARASAQVEAGRAREALLAESEARLSAERNLYRAHIREALDAIERGHMSRAESLLFRYVPEEGIPDVRGWEWYYLTGRLDGDSLILGRHSSTVRSVAFSPTGDRYASIGENQIFIWDVRTNRPLERIHLPIADLTAASFSPDGKQLAVLSRDGRVRLVNVIKPSPPRIQTLSAETVGMAYRKPSWSPDGKKLAFTDTLQVHIWDLEQTGGPRSLSPPDLEKGDVYTVAWSPGGDELAIGSGGCLTIVDAQTGNQRIHEDLHGHDLWTLDWSADGERIATGSYNQQAIVLDADTGEILHKFTHSAGVESVAFSPDGASLACATRGEVVVVWDIETGELSASYTGHRDWVTSIAWHPNGKSLVAGAADGSIRAWRTERDPMRVKGRVFPSFVRHNQRRMLVKTDGAAVLGLHDFDDEDSLFQMRGKQADWNVSGDRIATAEGQIVRIYDVGERRQIHSFGIENGHRPTEWSGNGEYLASSNGEELHIWHVTSGQKTMTLPSANSRPWLSDFWSTRGAVLGLVHDGELQLWDASSNALLGRLEDDRVANVFGIAWSPNGERLVVSAAGGLFICEASSARVLHELRGHAPHQHIFSAAWSHDGKLLATGSWDQTIRIWDTESGQAVHTFDGHSTALAHLAFTRDGSRLASCDWAGFIKIWDVAEGEATLTFQPLKPTFKRPIRDLAWLEDGSLSWMVRSAEGEEWDGKSPFGERASRRGYDMEESGELAHMHARFLFRQALRMARSCQLSESARHFTRAEAIVGVQEDWRIQRARVLMDTGLVLDAERDLVAALKANPSSFDARFELAWLLANREDNRVRQPDKAEGIARQLLAEYPGIGELWSLLAASQYRQDNWFAARESADRALKLTAHSLRSIPEMLLALAQARTGEVERAREAFNDLKSFDGAEGLTPYEKRRWDLLEDELYESISGDERRAE